MSSEEEFDLEDIEEDTEMRNALADEVSELQEKKSNGRGKRIDSEDFVVSDQHEDTPMEVD